MSEDADTVAPVVCYGCKKEITGLIVWLGEHYEGQEPEEYPFHSPCADQPWPFYETRRSFAKG